MRQCPDFLSHDKKFPVSEVHTTEERFQDLSYRSQKHLTMRKDYEVILHSAINQVGIEPMSFVH